MSQIKSTFPNLPLKQVRQIRFQVRPYQWVEFRNVALKAAEHDEGVSSEKSSSTTSEESDSSQLLQQGLHLLWEKGQVEEALKKFQRAAEIDPKNPNAWDGLGWAYFNCGKSAEAEKAFEETLKLLPEHLGSLNGLGQSYFFEKNYEKAEMHLLKAASLGAPAWYGLTRIYLMQGKYAEAERWAQKIVDSNPADEIAKQLLQAAKEKHISDEVRSLIEPTEKNSTDNNAKTPSAKPHNFEERFSPVIERTVMDDRAKTDWMIDLDTGVLHTPPGGRGSTANSRRNVEVGSPKWNRCFGYQGQPRDFIRH